MTCRGPGDCGMVVHAKGLCAAHYQQERRGQRLRPLRDPIGSRSLWEQLVDAALDLASANDVDAPAWERAKTRLRVAALRYVRGG